MREYAKAEGITILKEFVDAETAKKTGRTDFGQMLAFLRQNRACKIVLVEKTDRLYRNLKDWVTVDELCLQLHLVKENVILSPDSRSNEKMFHGIKVLMAKNYIDNLSEETRKGMLEKAEEGLWPSTAQFGYRNAVRLDGKKVIEPDPDTAPTVKQLFEWYATGNYSLKEVAEKAMVAGLVPVPRASIHGILRNRIYTGDFDWAGKTYPGIHTPIVDRGLWDEAQRALDRRFASRHRKVKHDFAFSGLVSCGHCGCSLVGEIKKKRYVYYHCTGYRGKCPEPYITPSSL